MDASECVLDTGYQGEKGRHSIGPTARVAEPTPKGRGKLFLFMRNHLFPFFSILDIQYHAAAQFLLVVSPVQGKLRIKAEWGCRKLNKLRRNKLNSFYLCQKLTNVLALRKIHCWPRLTMRGRNSITTVLTMG